MLVALFVASVFSPSSERDRPMTRVPKSLTVIRGDIASYTYTPNRRRDLPQVLVHGDSGPASRGSCRRRRECYLPPWLGGLANAPG